MYPLLHYPHHHPHPCCCSATTSTTSMILVNQKEQWCVPGGVSVSLRRDNKSESENAVVAVAASRDRVVDFGKYKGKMLGSLPSSYLRWVSKNLRARDFEEWANLADQVLRDPIYRDRIEWEFALNVLNGNANANANTCSSSSSELHDISERFGWDNLDRVGWSKVDFDLLGTSKGGRIPRRLNDNINLNHTVDDTMLQHQQQPKQPSSPSNSTTVTRSKRMERRRERRRQVRTPAQQQINKKNDGIGVNQEEEEEEDYKNKFIPIANPFPGRQVLMLKAINHRKTTNSHPQL